MNKKTIGIIFAGLLIILLVISATIDTDNTKKTLTKLTDDTDIILENAQNQSTKYKGSKEQNPFIKIKVDEYLEYYKDNKNRIVFIGRPTCYYCQIAVPIIQKLSYDYDLEVNYVNVDEFEGDDESNFLNSDEKYANGFQTPLLVIIGNNKIKDEYEGLTDYAHYLKMLKDNKIIK